MLTSFQQKILAARAGPCDLSAINEVSADMA
jgi:hypothetical protein